MLWTNVAGQDRTWEAGLMRSVDAGGRGRRNKEAGRRMDLK